MLNAPALSVTAAAQLLAVDGDQVRSWIASGQLPAVNVSASGRSKRPTWRILDVDLQAFLARRSSRPATVATATRRPRAKARNVIEFFK